MYAKATNEIVRPLLNKDYTTIDEIDCDLQIVCKDLVRSAEALIPKQKSNHTDRLRDQTLSHLCWKSCCVFRKWKEAGRPRHGPIADERKQCKRNVNSYLKKCRAVQVSKQIQRLDNLIQQNHPHRFRSKHQVKTVCSKLLNSE